MKARRLTITLTLAALVSGSALDAWPLRTDPLGARSMGPVQVVRYKTPQITVVDAPGRLIGGCLGAGLFGAGAAYLLLKYAPDIGGGATGGALTGGLLGAAVGLGYLAGSAVVASGEGAVAGDSAALPDIGELTVQRLAQRVPMQFPQWTPVTVAADRATEYESHRPSLPATTITVRVGGLSISSQDGLVCTANTCVLGRQGHLLASRPFRYDSRRAGRKHSIEEYKSNDFAILREEIGIVADSMASDFMQYLGSTK